MKKTFKIQQLAQMEIINLEIIQSKEEIMQGIPKSKVELTLEMLQEKE